MKKILTFIIINLLFTLHCIDSEYVKITKEAIRKNIDFVLSVTDSTNDDKYVEIEQYLKSSDMLKSIYLFDGNDILYKENILNGSPIPSKILHGCYAELLLTNRDKIYLSEFINSDDKVIYALGRYFTKIKVLYFFYLPTISKETFLLTDVKGDIRISSGFTYNEKYLDIINDMTRDSLITEKYQITKFNFFKNHNEYYYIEEK